MCRNQTLNFINVSLQESSSLHWCSDLPAASSLDRCALNSMWTPSSLTPVSWMCPYSVILSCVLFLACAVYWPTPCLPAGKLNITPEDPRWIGAWWAGFLLCGALLFCSAVLMFGFPQSLPAREREEGADSEQVMLPPSLSSDCETPKPSNGVVVNHEPANSPTCCQQLRGEHAASSVVLQFFLVVCVVFLMQACMEQKHTTFNIFICCICQMLWSTDKTEVLQSFLNKTC